MSTDPLAFESEQLMIRLAKSSHRYDANVVDEAILRDILFQWGENAVDLEQAALQLESNPGNADTIAGIKRILHSIKGDAGVCGLTEVAEAFHELESLLEQYLKKKVNPTDLLLRVTDWLRNFLENIGIAGPDGFSGSQAVISKGIKDEAQKVSLKYVNTGCLRKTIKKGEESMKTLIVEDDFTSRLLLQGLLKDYGPSHIAVNGKEAVEAVRGSLQTGEPYDLICLDIMMPEMDGQEALRQIREQEEAKGILSTRGAKIVMTTTHSDMKNLSAAFNNLCDAYLTKPIEKAKLIEELRKLGLIS